MTTADVRVGRSATLSRSEVADLERLEAVIAAGGYPRRGPKPPRVSVKADLRPNAVYIFRDARERVLYVGISLSVLQRLGAHTQHGWFHEVSRIDLEWEPNRAAALRREAGLIAELDPVHNVAGKR